MRISAQYCRCAKSFLRSANPTAVHCWSWSGHAKYGSTLGNIGIGGSALAVNTSGTQNNAVGYSALAANTTGYQNIAFGNSALIVNTTGNYNSAFGYCALKSSTTGSQNTAIGDYSLYLNTTGSNNVGLGVNGGRNELGSDNTHVGCNSTNAVAGTFNSTGCTSLGSNAGPTVSGLSNSTAIGYQAAVTTSNTIQLGNSSVTNVNTSGTITAGGYMLPTSGGTATALNYYEVYNYSTTFSGPATTPTVHFKIVRVGNQVTMTQTDGFVSITPSTSTFFYSNTNLPSRFIPAANLYLPIVVTNNGSQVFGIISAGQGLLEIYNGYSSFGTAGYAGWQPFSITWNV